MFGIDYKIAVVTGTVVIVLYTLLGGFLAVCWTDLFQGILMFFAILIVPILAYNSVGGAEAIKTAIQAKEISLSLFHSANGRVGIISIISALAWGIGYFGQPHILARFMSISSIKELPKSALIATVWVFISLIGAVAIGLVAIPMFNNLPQADSEKVFILMITKLFNPWVGGILLAAILSAIMSTIDSQLLVSSSTLTEDFYRKVVKKEVSEEKLVSLGRLCVLIISVIALFMALNPKTTILGLVSYAWGGFGAAFGPVIIMALFSKKTTWKSALAGMLVGTVVLVTWKLTGLGVVMYELLPAFIANFATMAIVNIFIPQDNSEIEEEFIAMEEEVNGVNGLQEAN
jgi:sodium/proline symporter